MKVPDIDTHKVGRLPDWVKCMKCGEKPKQHDWLIEVVANSNALIHQSCAANQGKIAGLNIGAEKGEKE